MFAAGAVALRLFPALADSLPFMVFWTAIVPFLAACALVGTIAALVRMLWYGAVRSGWKRGKSMA